MNTGINCNVFSYIVDNFNVCFNYCYIRDVTKAMVYVQLKWWELVGTVVLKCTYMLMHVSV